MFNRTPKETTKKLEEAELSVLESMVVATPEKEEYAVLLSHLERIEALRQPYLRARINPNNVALVAGNLLGILVIVAYEQKHVFVSQAKGMLLKSSK